MLTHTTTIRVRYADTDKMKFVYNGKYLEYFEVGRTEILRQVGLPYSKLESAGYQLPLIEADTILQQMIEKGYYSPVASLSYIAS